MRCLGVTRDSLPRSSNRSSRSAIQVRWHTLSQPRSALTGVRNRAAIRTTALAMIGLTFFVIAMIASYSGAFAKPTLHHMAVAVSGAQQLVDGIRGQDALAVTEVGDDDAAAREQVYERKTDAAFVVAPTGEMKIYVAGGGGHSVATAAETVGRTIAAKADLQSDRRGRRSRVGRRSVRHRRVLRDYLHLDRCVRRRNCVGAGHGHRQAADTGAANRDADRLFGGSRCRRDRLRRRDSWRTNGSHLAAVRCAVALRDGRRWSGHVCGGGVRPGRLGGSHGVPGRDRQRRAGPVGRPLLSGFYATFTAIVPQGSRVSLLRSVSYFGDHGAQTPLVTLAIWGAAGCLLAIRRHRLASELSCAL